MPCLESKIFYHVLPSFAFVFCPDFVDIYAFLYCGQLIGFSFVLLSYFVIQEVFSVSACNGFSLVRNVVPFLASVSAISLQAIVFVKNCFLVLQR
jgi:hypothetical protein